MLSGVRDRFSLPLTAAAFALGLAAAPSAFAQSSEQADLDVSATVVRNCTITTTPLAFGNYDPVGTHAAANLDGTGVVTVACTKGMPGATIGLSLGDNVSAPAQRRMTNGTDFLNYEIYKNAARTQVWGNAGADLLTPTPPPNKNPRDFDAYGRVPAGQDVSEGLYTDTVVATVNF